MLLHELAGDLQALDGNAGCAGDEIANSFVVDLIGPPCITSRSTAICTAMFLREMDRDAGVENDDSRIRHRSAS